MDGCAVSEAAWAADQPLPGLQTDLDSGIFVVLNAMLARAASLDRDFSEPAGPPRRSHHPPLSNVLPSLLKADAFHHKRRHRSAEAM